MAKRPRRQTFIQASRRISPAEKAAFHVVSGAGKSHVKRDFFGLSKADEDLILSRVQRHLDQAVKG